ncbi:helix-turn-helix domain-containing protein [Neolewinella agarilytica]|uniref:helix-turn-helix domain-containing protein n=1 Tax=Neolewinella agarilytica TaxID=478744 RepID=UPI0023544244|nr:AraC family transcriptional regulator [Neolewinella agarilytica]
MFEFNEWSGPLLPGFLQGLVFAAILALRGYREERISDYLAALLLLMGSLYVGQWMLGFAGWYDAHDWRTTLMFYIEWKNLLAFGPLIWLYFRALTNTDFRWERRYWWHFVPLLIVLLEPIIVFLYDWFFWRLIKGAPFEFFYGTRGPAAEWANNDNGFQFWYYGVAAFSFCHLIFYLIKTLKDYRHYRQYLAAEFSNANQLSFSHLRFTLYLMLFGVSLTFLLELGNLIYSTSYIDSWDSFFVMSVFTFLVAIQFLTISPTATRALRFEPEKQTPTTTPADSSNPKPASNPAASAAVVDEDLQRWAEKLTQRLDSHEDYLNPDLKMGELASQLRTNSSILSKVINTVHGQNFNDYINGLRCEVFLDKVRAGEHLRHTLLSLALDCGFNSKSTFNRAFRKYAGKSPGQMVREIGPES